MRALRTAFARFAAFLRREHHDREFDAEMQAHLQMSIEDHLRCGRSPAEARRAALVALGGLQPTRDLHRETRGLPWLETLLQDARYGVRSMRRTPAFTITAILILALGIGANALVFSVVHAVLLRPLPFAAPERLVWIENHYDGNDKAGLSGRTSRAAMLEEWERRTRSFEALTAFNAFFGYGSYKLTAGGEPERVLGVPVAQDFFDVLRVPLLHGRAFTADEVSASGPGAVILDHDFWQRRFAADPAIVGRQVTLNDRTATVVGIAAETFDFGTVFAPGMRVQVFAPLVIESARQSGNTLAVIGRLAPGVSLEQARGEIIPMTARIAADNPGWGAQGVRLEPLREHVAGGIRPVLLALGAAVAIVLLIVCANLANLMLSRGAARQRELAVRTALGAGRLRLVRQLLTETLALAVTGAALGFFLARGAAGALAAWPDLTIPLLRDVRLDWPAAAFTGVVTVAAAVLAGLFPALQLSKGDVQGPLTDAARGTTGAAHRTLRSALVVAEIALACVLLVGAGLLLRSFERLLALDLGFRPDHAVAVQVEPNRTMTEAAARRQFAADAVRRVGMLPGVTAVGLSDTLPLDRDRAWGVTVPGRVFSDAEAPVAHVRMIAGEYFPAMAIGVRQGRVFTEAEAFAATNLAIVNRTMGRTLWPDADPLGREVVLAGRQVRIIGVVEDVRHTALEKPAGFEVYLPIGWFTIRSAELIVRSELPVAQLAPSIRGALRPMDPTMPLADVKPLTTLVDRATSSRRLYTGLIAAFAAVALVLACLGIFGVISYGVTQRTTEIGIRMALGASARGVASEVVYGTLKLAGIGVAVGAAASVLTGRSVEALLFGVTPLDLLTFGAAVLVLLGVALLAAWLPARRAARVDPLAALRGP